MLHARAAHSKASEQALGSLARTCVQCSRHRDGGKWLAFSRAHPVNWIKPKAEAEAEAKAKSQLTY